MPAGLDALEHERVRTGLLGDPGFRDVGHGHPDLRARLVQRGDHLCRRAAEGERDHRHSLAPEHDELGLPLVVVVSRLAELDAVPGGLLAQALEVVRQRPLVHLGVARHEQVDAERCGRKLTHSADVGGHCVRGAVSGGDEAEPARGTHGSGELRGGRPPGQGCQHDRVAKLLEDHLRLTLTRIEQHAVAVPHYPRRTAPT